MKIIVVKDEKEMGKKGAEIFKEQILSKPNSVIGLATGSTPIELYKELSRMYKEDGLDFSKVTTFNLDEYIGLSPDNINSYHYFMHDNLFRNINVPEESINIPKGDIDDLDEFSKLYEQKIQDKGGIDIQLLGIGVNGHIGFNEPKEELMTHTGRVKLTESTIDVNARFFEDKTEVPTEAITMGMKTIFDAKKIVVIATGLKKHDVIKRLINQDFISTIMPVSILTLHPDCTLIVDEEAYYGK